MTRLKSDLKAHEFNLKMEGEEKEEIAIRATIRVCCNGVK